MSAHPNSFDEDHAAFAASRSSEFVFVPSDPKHNEILDQHSDTSDADTKLPLVVLGERGSGKSALLASWLNRRQQTKSKDEFLFAHFAGCSPRSQQLRHVLYRLATSLISFFNLREMKVPKTEEGLRWSLNRFLAAAAKKHFPARIVIVIDGVDLIQGDNAQQGQLHWLPTDIPPGVRFILSTVEFDKSLSPHTKAGSVRHLHRTYTELKRRKCPEMKLDPLGVEVRHGIINAFTTSQNQSFELNETQAFKIVTSRPSSQPLFLRTVLYALALGLEKSTASIDEQLDHHLAAESPDALISQILDQCSFYIEGENPVSQGATSILGATLSVLYVSRDGLTDEEIWGSIQLMLGFELNGEQKDCVLRILKDFCMKVKDCWMFTHAAVENVVYEKYIQHPENNIKLHQMMGRYFSRMEACDRKLNCLVWHLEVSGSWNKLKSTLVNIDNFNTWWDTEHNRTEFINLWSSLTNYAQRSKNTQQELKSLVTGQFREKKMRHNQVPRPYCDMVEEYTKSIDEYRKHHIGEDEVINTAILKVGDFFIEYAMLGHESQADVPDYVHPEIPRDDMKALGVPYLDEEIDPKTCKPTGLSALIRPQVDILERDEKGHVLMEVDDGGGEAPLAANDDMEVCSTYFFRRWMWIQFPLVALSNCGTKYNSGITRMEQNLEFKGGAPKKDKKNKGKGKGGKLSGDGSPKKSMKMSKSQASITLGDKMADTREGMEGMSLEEPARTKLPTIAFQRRGKRSRTVPRIPRKIAETTTAKDEIMGLAEREEKKIMNEISELREEYDNLVQQRAMLTLTSAKVDTDYTNVKNMEFAATENEEKVILFREQIDEVEDKYRFERQLKSNFGAILKMCARHPAHAQALIDELEGKLNADTTLIAQINDLLREEKYENVATRNYFKSMTKSVDELFRLHDDMRNNRRIQRDNLNQAGDMETARDRNASAGGGRMTMSAPMTAPMSRRSLDPLAVPLTAESDEDPELTKLELEKNHKYSVIQGVLEAKTGFSDVELFVSKYLSQPNLESQMMEMKRISDLRINQLKDELEATQKELTNVQSTISGSSGKDTKEKYNELSKEQGKAKRIKEMADFAENLYREVRSGLENVAGSVGIPLPHPDTSVHEILNQIDSVMEILMEEKDKTAQKTLADSHNNQEDKQRRYSTVADISNRPVELDAALQAYNDSKCKMPVKFYGKQPEYDEKMRDQEEEEKMVDYDGNEEDGELGNNRVVIKMTSTKAMRAQQRKRAREAALAAAQVLVD
ncbi:hypothetical protein TL16_g11057 [Triparma laevis f. inornata]|uniref:NACHT domain-containing protein n=1 Tax=Triparma laevis f. inornata TaxID=1714386 RepID=A0A9W7BCJ2_9STRA|nr:hypothetical protein TL16_g11057 [Triparma laevis f. inornata]